MLAIMAILGMLVYPTYLDVTRKAKRAEARASLMQIMQQQERYYASHQTYSAFSRTAPNGFKWFSGNNPVTSAYEISGEACGNDPLEACVRLVARAGTPYVSRGYRDDACRELTFTSTGVQAAVGNGDCW